MARNAGELAHRAPVTPRKASKRPLAGKPAVIVSASPSGWESNRAISPNLQEAYRRLWGGDYATYALSAGGGAGDVHKLARAIASRPPDRLVFVDHLPHPAALLRELTAAFKGRPLPPLYFHLYGDFTFYLRAWLALGPLLAKYDVSWICASDRQAELVRRLLANAPQSVSKCPFPVDPSRFAFDPALRDAARAKLGFALDDRVLIYAGRFSVQKNSLRLLREAARFIRTAPYRAHLLLAGGFDDIGAPFFGVRPLPWDYFQRWNRLWKSLPEKIRGRMRHLGPVDSSKLRELYHAADCYFSLSLHHDEDFGMAPAEALSCGSAAVLTDWGGYSSFPGASECCRLIPVSLDPRGLNFSSDRVQRDLLEQCRRGADADERRLRARRFLSTFSIDAAVSELSRIHQSRPPRFAGFSALASFLCAAGGPYFPGGPGKNSLYPKLYGAYYESWREKQA